MNKLEKVIYTAKAHTVGGREGGTSKTDDGRLNVRLTTPGTAGEGTNPEQLLAAGWSSCFLSAIKIILGKQRISIPNELSVDAEVDLGISQGAHRLGARLNVTLPGIDEDKALSVVEAASKICPYSVALGSSIEVHYSLMTPHGATPVLEAQHV